MPTSLERTINLSQELNSNGDVIDTAIAVTYGSNSYVQVLVDDHVSALVNAAPTTLDTLNELAAALGDDPNFATTVTNTLATKVANGNIITTDTVNDRIGIGNTSPTEKLHVQGTIRDDTSDVRAPRFTELSANTTIANEGVYKLGTGVSTITLGAAAAGTIMAIYNNVTSNTTLEDGATVTSMRLGADNSNTHNTTLTLGPRSMSTITWIDTNACVVTGTDVS